MRAVEVLVVLSVLMGIVLFASNLAALKIWRLDLPIPTFSPVGLEWSKIPVDAGIFLFPASYVAGDLLIFVFGQKIANRVAWCCAIFTILMIALFWTLGVLPDFPTADNSAFYTMRDATGRIFFASIVGFLASQLVNNYFFVFFRYHEETGYIHWSLKSSVLAHLIDAATFELIAFIGRLSFSDFCRQVAFAFLAGIALEFLLARTVGKYLAERFEMKLGFTDGRWVDHEPVNAWISQDARYD